MPIPSPFHPRTSELCTSLRWKDWAGYHAVCAYSTRTTEREYFAFRHAAGADGRHAAAQVRGHAGPGRRRVPRAGSWSRTSRSSSSGRSPTAAGATTPASCSTTARSGASIENTLPRDRRGAEPRVVPAQRPRLRRHRSRTAPARIAAVSLQGPNSREILQAAVRRGRGRRCGSFRLDPEDVDRRVRRRGSRAPATPATSATRSGSDNDDALDRLGRADGGGRDPSGSLPAGLDALDILRGSRPASS